MINIPVHIASAIDKLSSACEDLRACDDAVKYDDFKYYITRIEELIECDNGEAGLAPMLIRHIK